MPGDRLGAFLTAVLTDPFYIPASRYVDDLFLIDYSECADEARAIMLEVVNLLGFTLEEAKTPPPSFTQDILGVKVEITDSELLLTPEPRKVALWIQMINVALDKSSLGLADAMKLAGRLNFAASATWGQVARSRLRRLYGHIVNGNTDFGRPLASDLTWWLSRLERLEPQRLALFIDDPVVIYTDAEGNGGLGGVISDSATAAWFSSPTPQELVAALTPGRLRSSLWRFSPLRWPSSSGDIVYKVDTSSSSWTTLALWQPFARAALGLRTCTASSL